jgi:hypothetical protein
LILPSLFTITNLLLFCSSSPQEINSLYFFILLFYFFFLVAYSASVLVEFDYPNNSMIWKTHTKIKKLITNFMFNRPFLRFLLQSPVSGFSMETNFSDFDCDDLTLINHDDFTWIKFLTLITKSWKIPFFFRNIPHR